MNDWMHGTTVSPQGAFLQRNLHGRIAGLTPNGQGAFSALGAGLQGAGMAQMAGPGRSPAEMGLLGLAGGARQMQQQEERQNTLQKLLSSGAFGLGPMAMGGGDKAGLLGGLFGGAFMGLGK